MRLHRLSTAVLTTLALAGCGGSSSSAGDGGADPAQAVPAGVPVYVEGTVRPEGAQGDNARALLAKFLPPGTTLAGLIDDQIKQQGENETYEQDIKPWLGQRVGVGVTDLTAADPTYYGAVAITDADKAAAFLGKQGKERSDYSDAQLFQDQDTWAAVKGDYLVLASTQKDVKDA